MKEIRKYKDYFYFTGIIIILILVRVFVCDAFLIPTCSMENAIFENEYVLVFKFQKYLNKKISTPRRADVVVFYVDSKDNTRYIKRCIAEPGDKLEILDGNLCIFGKNIDTIPTILRDYKIDISTKAEILYLESFLGDHIYVGNDGIHITTTEKNSKIIKTKGHIKNLEVVKFQDSLFNNNFIIPYRGFKIDLTLTNYLRYRKILSEETVVQKKGTDFYINGKLTKTYIFRNNYYYLLGDNRPNSFDSRKYGLIPEEQIIGKAKLVLFSWDINEIGFKKIRFNRILHLI